MRADSPGNWVGNSDPGFTGRKVCRGIQDGRCVALHVAQRVYAHSKVEMTLNVYAHALPNQHRTPPPGLRLCSTVDVGAPKIVSGRC